VWAEWHRPSDTVAGLLIVLAWGGLVAAVLRTHRLRSGLIAGRPSRAASVLLGAGAAVAATVGLLGLVIVATSVRVVPILLPGRVAFLTGAVCVAAATAGVFLLWMRLASTDPPSFAAHPEAVDS
jgi:hypothetical protein